ncbi:hypothetical protein E1B28_001292 [Marasmius oreades]|uniref:Uncharacterized protein n=1 Tax=Marasmius oreades TaxID=181124 RepID=A0A9P7V330_9AGAR|nr:uncharacterized protein E1B28_001292 [Marasmius oreades]KAG7099441.1 hypothetical protein E1B28_001292 [Marasmius oreades]
MIFEQANSPHLKTWLVRTLEPICDAEPGALADYILALLQHNIPENEMRKELTTQLDEFLEKECPAFIETLFTALRSKSYLPYTTSPPPPPSKSFDIGIPIPLDGLLSSSESSRKRSLEQDDDEAAPPPKGPRLGSDDHFARYNNTGHDSRWANNRGRSQSNGHRDTSPNVNPRIGYHPPDQRRICRDYYNLGYCSRGALCKYSHGEDALIPTQLYMNNPMMSGAMPFMPMFANGFNMMGSGPVAAYDPHEAKMDMRPQMGNNRQVRPPVLPRMQNEDGSRVVMHRARTSGELPVIQDLTPEVAYQDVTPNPQQHSSHSHQSPPEATDSLPQGSELLPYTDAPPQAHVLDIDMTIPPSESTTHPRTNNGFRGGRGRGGPGNFRPERKKDKTLVLEKIPDDKLSLEHVNDWFKRFGTVTNVAIDQAHNKALISFSTHEEAFAAWKSEDAIFGNRFVKVFWHRPMEGQGQTGQRMLAASASVINNANSKDTIQTSKKPATPPSNPSASSSSNALAAKQQKLEQLISEQKDLMQSLDQAPPEERKSIMARLRKLDEEMKIISSNPDPSKRTSTDSSGAEQEKERLDKELELHSAVNGSGADGKETTEDLKAKLEKLRTEAASLGIPQSPLDTHYSSTYRPYRGRGRGYSRGAFRGGPPRASMKLDNRPRRLLIKDAASDGLQAVRDWYETTGQMESAVTTDHGDIIVSFKSRHAAEQGLAKGSSIPVLGTVRISWYTGPLPDVSPTTANDTSTSDTKSEPREASPARSTQHEEEVASGWGGDDDSMGMI